jgi:hypothetical protein
MMSAESRLCSAFTLINTVIESSFIFFMYGVLRICLVCTWLPFTYKQNGKAVKCAAWKDPSMVYAQIYILFARNWRLPSILPFAEAL